MKSCRERTLDFISGKKVDRPPFHPIIMRFAARYAGVNYSDFCLKYTEKCKAMIKCAVDFDVDWVTVMSDPYAEASALGMQFTYPVNDLPVPKANLIQDMSDIDKMKKYKPLENPRTLNRINEIREFKRLTGDKYFVVGWVEGAMAEYADIRGFGEACIDLIDYYDKVEKASDIIIDSALDFITEQVKAGADCIGIGDAACSQIGPELYESLFFKREKILVDHVHSLGATAKLHICGNTASIQPLMIKTGADIIDVDHLVGDMAPFVKHLGSKQVFSGNSDPVSVIKQGTEADIFRSVESCFKSVNGRCIVSAGCEVPPETSLENFEAYRKAAQAMAKYC